MSIHSVFRFSPAFWAGVTLLALTGCVYTGVDFTPVQDGSVRETTERKSGSVSIIEGDIPDRTYIVLGNAEAYARSFNLLSSDPTREDINEALRTEAAQKGGDAVIDVHYQTESQGLASRGKMLATGKIVQFVNPKD